jgi:hypothetical protein
MSPRGQFLDFVNSKVSEGVDSFKEKLEAVAEDDDCSFKELSHAFYIAYEPCFNATAVAVPKSSIYSDTFYSAANIIGQAFLSYGRSKKDTVSYNKAIAWFKSAPRFSTSAANEKSDICIVDFVELAEKEKASLENMQQKLEELQKADFSKFFK